MLTLRCLSDNAYLVCDGKINRILPTSHNDPPARGVPKQSDDLGMPLVPHDNDGRTPGNVLLNNGLNTGLLRAGGVNNFQASLLDFSPFLGRYAVGSND